MPTNRQILKEKVATYASVLLDGAYEAGGQDAVLEVRDQAERILRIARRTWISPTLGGQLLYARAEGQLVRNLVRIQQSRPRRRSGRHGRARGLRVAVARMGQLWRTARTQAERHCRRRHDRRRTGRSSARGHYEEAEADLGTNVVLREHIDKSLLGGILMSANGKRIDASVLSQLESARNVLKLSTDGGEC